MSLTRINLSTFCSIDAVYSYIRGSTSDRHSFHFPDEKKIDLEMTQKNYEQMAHRTIRLYFCEDFLNKILISSSKYSEDDYRLILFLITAMWHSSLESPSEIKDGNKHLTRFQKFKKLAIL
jgi:hypothetical protein